MKEVNKLAPEFLKQFGFDEKEISDCIKNVEFENKIRDGIILKMKDKYHISRYKEDFPVVWYLLKDGEQNIFIEHDCSKWINIYKDERYNVATFDPLEKDCFENITCHIENLIGNIKI